MDRRIALTLLTTLVWPGVAVSTSAVAQQSQFGTAAEARAMLDKAVAAIKADKVKALQLFNSGEGSFRDRDLYVFCFDAKTGSTRMWSRPS